MANKIKEYETLKEDRNELLRITAKMTGLNDKDYWKLRMFVEDETIQKLKLLKERIKDGCSEEFDNEKVKAFMYCGASYNGVTDKLLCPSCEELKKKIFALVSGDEHED